MTSVDGRLWIVFNGEVYNHLNLRAELAAYGHKFRTRTDTEVALAAYRQWGPECLSRFNGMWAFALWDSEERYLFLARDRFGIKPLYYVHEGDTFAFASEIKALVGGHGIPFEPDADAVYRYLAGSVFPSPQEGRTFFNRVCSLPPGHWMEVRDGAVTQHRYWALPQPPKVIPDVEAADIVKQYRELFTDSVRLRLSADVPVGTCLSGGVDSSSIVCVVNRLVAQNGVARAQIGEHQKAFSAVYQTDGRYNERPYIERMLQATGAEGTFAFPTGEWLQSDVERLVWHQDEPFQSTSIFAQWCVMSAIRERGVIVSLDGQGPDEVLAGYRPFVPFLGDLIRGGSVGNAIREARAIEAHTGLSAGPLLFRALGHQIPRRWADALRRRRAELRRDVAVLNPDFVSQQRSKAVSHRWISGRHRSLDGHLRDLVVESNLPRLLQYEDRNSMAFSVEARVPYLDHRLVEFSFVGAPCCRIRDGWTKWVLRKAMEGIVPDEIVWRRDKVGFETPEDIWLLQWHKSQPDFFGDDALSCEYLDLGAVRRRLAAQAEAGGVPASMWRWVNLELWLRIWSAA
jgi:asparagine synthase (glutamine-hydrolysing)